MGIFRCDRSRAAASERVKLHCDMIAIRGATMNTRRITVDLPNASYRNLRRLVESGQYASESEALAEVLLDVGLEPAHAPGDPEFDRWMREEVLVADDELE